MVRLSYFNITFYICMWGRSEKFKKTCPESQCTTPATPVYDDSLENDTNQKDVVADVLDSESAQKIDEGDANIEPTDKELDVKEDIHSQSDSNGISPADLVDVPKGLLQGITSLVGKIGILKDPLQLMGKENGLANKLYHSSKITLH